MALVLMFCLQALVSMCLLHTLSGRLEGGKIMLVHRH